MNSQPISRREKILKAGSTMFITVAIASVVVAFAIVATRFLWERKSYNDRVIEAKTTARNTITQNVNNLSQLSGQFTQLNKSASTNATTVLHALPPTYDYASLASSLESLAQRSGVSLEGTIGPDDSANALSEATTSAPVEIPLSLQVSGSYNSVKRFIANLERSIRPISISNANYSGSNTDLQATLTATTYYQPTRSLDVARSPL